MRTTSKSGGGDSVVRELSGHLVVLSRAAVVEDREGVRRVQGADGRLVDRMSARFRKVSFLAPIVRPAQAEAFERLRGVAHRFADRVDVVELNEDFGASIRIGSALRRLARQMRTLRRVLKSADAAFVFMPSFRAVAAALICRATGVPFAVYLGTRWRDTSRVRARLSGWRARLLPMYSSVAGVLERWTMAAAGARLVTGPALHAAYSHLAGPTIETPPVVDFDLAQLDAVLADSGERPVRESSAPTLLYLGALMPGKNVDLIIGAVARLRATHPKARLIVVGAGPEMDRLKALAEERLGGDEACRFEGYVGDPIQKLRFYARADLLVLASVSEGFPRVIYEALASGVPVVSTDLPGFADNLPGGSLEMVPRADEIEIAEGIRKALRPERFEEMLRSGRPAARRALRSDSGAVATALLNDLLI